MILRKYIFILICIAGLCAVNDGFAQLTKIDAPRVAPGNPVRMSNDDGTVTDLQATHILRQTVYVNTTGSKKLVPQTVQSFIKYNRWFLYNTKGPLPSGFTLSGTTAFSDTSSLLYLCSSSHPTVSITTLLHSFSCHLRT